MFATVFEKELKAILLSPKFVSTFAVLSVLLLLSVFIGIQDYSAAVSQYESAVQLAEQELSEATNWSGLRSTVYRRTDPMQILAAGVNNDIGRLSTISTSAGVKLRQSIYLEDTLFALFRFIDFTFVVQVVLSLFAILFTYDAINGERASGTLRLAFASPVPRGTYLAAKFAGAWTGLVAPLAIPIGLVILMLVAFGIPLEGDHWYRIVSLIGLSLLYFTVFVALGLLVSALTRSPRISFLALLVLWVAGVLIVPRAATMAAAQWVEVPSVAEIEATKDRFRKDRRDQYMEEMMESYRSMSQETSGMSEEEADQYRDDNRDRWEEETNRLEQDMDDDIANHERMLSEDLQNRKREQERLTMNLARIVPPAAYQIAALNIAGTNVTLKPRYEDAMSAYRSTYSRFVELKTEEEREEMRMQRDGATVVIRGMGDDTAIDASEMPRFEVPEQTFSEAIRPSLIDLGILAFFSVTFFGGAFVAFRRYDVR